MTTVSDGLYQYGGVPVLSDSTIWNKVWFVDPSAGSDSNSGRKPTKAFLTLAAALSHATANNGEAVFLLAKSNTDSSTTDYQSVALDWNKDGVHLIGVNCGPMIGQRSRIGQLSTVKNIENLFTVSANNCIISNIEVFQGVDGSTATAPKACVISGQRNSILNCQFSGIADSVTTNSMDVAGARSLSVSGSENIFKHCYIGLDTLSRATAAAEMDLVAGSSAATRNIFEDCVFSTMSGAAGFVFVSIGSAAIDRFVLFKNCTFLNAINSTATTMTAAMTVNAAAGGSVVLHNCMFVGATDITASDSSVVQHLGLTGSSAASNEHLNMSLAKTVDVS